MSISPKRTKYAKSHKLFQEGKTCRRHVVSFGNYGMKVISCGRITANQLKSAKLVLTKQMKLIGGKVWMRVFPDLPVTQKPAEVRMGGGKGPVEFWATTLKAGVTLFEIDCNDEKIAIDVLRAASYKLPLHTKIIKRVNHVSVARD